MDDEKDDDEIKFDDWNYEEINRLLGDWNYEEINRLFDDLEPLNVDELFADCDLQSVVEELNAEISAGRDELLADLTEDEIFKGFNEVVNSEREKFDMSLEANIFGNDTTANKGKAGRRRRRKSK